MNILFLIPDSFGIRNYLYSPLLSKLNKKANIYIWSPLPNEIFNLVRDLHLINLSYTQITLCKESFIVKFLRDITTYGRLIINSRKVQNNTILTNWNYKSKGILRDLYNYTVLFLGLLVSSNYRVILFLEKISLSFWSKKQILYYEIMLKKLKINKVFISHQRVSSLLPICFAAQNNGVEVISVIYSWDNLPKASLYVKANTYLVWSDYMKQEMATYYPEILQDNVIVTGTPQFEFYKKKELIIDRCLFGKKYGFNPSKRWILYSGGDTLTSPYDQNYLNDLVEALQDKQDIQIIFRRSPADFSYRYESVLNRYEGQLFSLDPIWLSGSSWSSNVPLVDDFELLVNLAYHCDLAVNVGSTIAHDFANFNKPSIYVNYNPTEARDWDIRVVNHFQHFKSMMDLDAVTFVNHKGEWASTICNVIDNPGSFAIHRQQWYGKINFNGDTPPSKIISDLLLT
jgi:hypothetical protein